MKQANLIERTKNKRIELLYEQCPSSATGSLLASLLVLVIFYWETRNSSYLIWFAITAGVSISRIILGKNFLKLSPKEELYQKWCNYYLISVVFVGAAWSSLIFIDLSLLTVNFKTLTFLVIVFICFGAISNYSYVLSIFYAALTTLTIVFVSGLLIIQGENFIFFIALFAGLFPALIITSRRFNANLIDSLTKQIEVEKLLKQLESSHEQLEEKISERTVDLIEAKEIAENANRAKTDFLANVTHELRTPMHAILSFSSLGSKKTRTASIEKIESYFEKINKSGHRLLEFVNALLNMSKMESGQFNFNPEKNSINEVLEDCLQELATQIDEKNIAVSVAMTKISSNFYFDSSSIHQVFTNLLSNAIKFSPKNGKVIITLTQINNNQRVTIKDQGVGLPDEELDQIFDQFIQSSYTRTGAGGTGLGLSICKQIISVHQGLIWAENCSDSGACFHFELPMDKSY